MKNSLLILTMLSLAAVGVAGPDKPEQYRALERRLQSLKSLEIHYRAFSDGDRESAVEGRMVWVKPDRFYHDTPEWTMVETPQGVWRHLKAQNTLIWERNENSGEWRPDAILTNLSADFKPARVEQTEDLTVLYLESRKSDFEGTALIEFPASGSKPSGLELRMPDHTAVRYDIIRWEENVSADAVLFAPPEVPAENVIDLRGVGAGK